MNVNTLYPHMTNSLCTVVTKENCVTMKLHLCQSHAVRCMFLRSRPFYCLYCCIQHHLGNVYEHIKHSSAFDCKNSPFANSSLVEIPFFANHKQGHLITNQVGARDEKTKF